MQKWLIVATVVLGVVSFGTLIYSYERYQRGPTDSVLFGTWLYPGDTDDPMYFEFRPDHTFSVVALISGEKTSIMDGRWYAGGQNIYLRFPADELGGHRPFVWHIADISTDEIRVRMHRDGGIWSFKRVNLASPHASNQSLEPTAGHRDMQL